MHDEKSNPPTVLPPAIDIPAPEPRPAETVLWDASNPRALINLVPEKVREMFDQHQHEKIEWFEMDERDLAKALRAAGKIPSPVDNRLRLRFWMEYDYAQTYHLKGIDISRVLAGICSREYFYKTYLRSPSKVAWLLCPPSSYMIKAEEALEYGLDQLRDILEQDHMKNGWVDPKVADLKLKIVAFLEPRVKGAIVQKSMNVHAVTANPAVAGQISKALVGPTMEQMELRRKVLQEHREKLTNGGMSGAKKLETSDEE